ncbi:M20/M25/M40 family metallo-hydrolase [Flavobacterium seoulense]|uniref:Vacuolar membrane protease n=1 Tax=Flavobacterium seoulense TaxID=1492738 RepID=A0A066WVG0_9FLAO|nr:M20/M25/M40 family metallo-hydrolase [Flavobacterium seoulense]KDN56583.1 peptidase M28 [Flavobacterium seoulense]
MKKDLSSVFSMLFFITVLAVVFFSMMPQWTSDENKPLAEFSTERALVHIKNMSQKPHYVGSENHNQVANYLRYELTKLGLETSFQNGYTLTDWGNLTKSKNILARIKGSQNGKALLLLSHYDSAPHSASLGASDDATGVATILEGVRAFLHSKTPHKNDIIILFTDAEELGLNGAALFVTQHQWAKEVGLALNFEARGTSGPSYMLMETNNGNAGMVENFAAANPTFPVSNSLMYSIYKMLPNDTDLTVFREQGSIQGFNFAFIDSHYNYHTAQDDIQHLDVNSLAHQGSYLMPLLNYFSNADLNTTEAVEDYVYFSIPFSFISYPFSWVIPMVIVAFVVFLFFIFLGIAKRILTPQKMLQGFVPFLGSLFAAGLITFLGWQLLLQIYPQYNDLLNGFTYNGHAYIAAFVSLSLAICFAFYHFFTPDKITANHFVAPIFIWLLINIGIAFGLQGAGFLIIPTYFGIFAFGFYILTQKYSPILNLIFSISALLIIAPFIQMFPIGLGLKMLFATAILTALCFGLLLPTLGNFIKKGSWSILFLLASIGFFTKAHLESNYEKGKAKSNSLIYLLDADTNSAQWLTYDKNLDSWTKNYLGENPNQPKGLEEIPLFSKYDTHFTFAAKAPLKNIPQPTIDFLTDSISDGQRYLKIRISPNRKVNRYDIFANEKMQLHNIKANGVTHLQQKGKIYKREGKKLLSYYVVDNDPLVLEFNINTAAVFDMTLLESSFDLMQNPLFTMNKRADWMMPTPFVLNDAVTIKKVIKPSPRVVLETKVNTLAMPTRKKPIVPKAVQSVEPKIAVDTIK